VTLVVVPMVLGLVALNAVLAQTSFRADDLTTKVDTLTDRSAELRKNVAVLSAPGRIDRWAQGQGMIPPDPHDVHVLHPPGTGAETRPDGGRAP
jgi:hypothetical protein